MSAIDKIIDVYNENVDDSEWVTNARAELAQLRWRVAMLEVLDGDDGLIAANRLMEACERGDIPQQLMPDIQEARNEIVSLRDVSQRRLEDLEAIEKKCSELRATVAEQARQLAEARALIDEITDDYIVSIDKDGLSYVSTNIIIDMIDFLVDNPAHQAPQEEQAQ